MLCIGVMSGTSCDGVDVALVDFGVRQKTLATHFKCYPDHLKATLHKLISEQSAELSELSQLDIRLARFYAEVVGELLASQQIHPHEVSVLGLHGQTIYHDPDHTHANTIQWGSAAMVAALTGIDTVAEFRQMDVALGGQGAPLAPAFHQHLLRLIKRPAAILNLGGIANLTVRKGQHLIGFDTGPANCLLDGWCARHLGVDLDSGGQWAAQGQVIADLLSQLLADPYFQRQPPKSTGRELFNLEWLDDMLADRQYRAVDVQRTLLALTAKSVAAALEATEVVVDEVYVCGGGVHNSALMNALSDELSVPVLSTASLGVAPDDVEAVLMAWLAWQNSQRMQTDLRAVTGAAQAHVYGVLHKSIR